MNPTAVFNVLASAAFAISTQSSAIASTRFATAIADEPPITEKSSISSLPDGRWVAEVPVEPFPRPVMIQLAVDGSTEPSSITASIPVLGMFSGTPIRRTVEDGVVRLDFASVGVTCQMDLRAATAAGERSSRWGTFGDEDLLTCSASFYEGGDVRAVVAGRDHQRDDVAAILSFWAPVQTANFFLSA